MNNSLCKYFTNCAQRIHWVFSWITLLLLYQVYSALKKHTFRRKSRVWNIQKDQNVTFLALGKELPVQKNNTDIHRDKAVKMNITQKWICAYIISFISISETTQNQFICITDTNIDWVHGFQQRKQACFCPLWNCYNIKLLCLKWQLHSQIRSEQLGISFRLIISIYAYNWPLNACFFSEKEQRSS